MSRKNTGPCVVEGCAGDNRIRGLCLNHYQKQYRRENPDYAQRMNERRRAQLTGCTPHDYERAMRVQGGLCAICHLPEKLQADHDHKTGTFRALLCGHCNRAIGNLRDDPERCRNAAIYLEKFNRGS